MVLCCDDTEITDEQYDTSMYPAPPPPQPARPQPDAETPLPPLHPSPPSPTYSGLACLGSEHDADELPETPNIKPCPDENGHTEPTTHPAALEVQLEKVASEHVVGVDPPPFPPLARPLHMHLSGLIVSHDTPQPPAPPPPPDTTMRFEPMITADDPPPYPPY